MEQTAKPPEAQKPKNRTILYAIIIVALIVVGVSVYILTLPPAKTTTIGERITIWDTSGACIQTASPPDCGFKDANGNVNVTIAKGTTVEWKNTGGQAHTVTSCDAGHVSTYGTSACPTTNNSALPSFDSGSMAAGSTYDYTFNTNGTYAYMCYIHIWMHGTVVVTP